MPNVMYNSLNGGMMTRKMRYRTDIEKRNKAVELAKNCNVLKQGGVKKRSGTKVINSNIDLPGNTYIESFDFPSAGVSIGSHTVVFTQIGDDSYVSVVSNNDGIEISNSFIGKNIDPTDFVTLNDVMIVVFSNREPIEIRRVSDSDIRIADYVYNPPLGEDNIDEFIVNKIDCLPNYAYINQTDENNIKVDNVFMKATKVEISGGNDGVSYLTAGYNEIKIGQDAGAKVVLVLNDLANTMNQCVWNSGVDDGKLQFVNATEFSPGDVISTINNTVGGVQATVKVVESFPVREDYTNIIEGQNYRCMEAYVCEQTILVQNEGVEPQFVPMPLGGQRFNIEVIDGSTLNGWNEQTFKADQNPPEYIRCIKDFDFSQSGNPGDYFDETLNPTNFALEAFATAIPVTNTVTVTTGDTVSINENPDVQIYEERWSDNTVVNKTVEFGIVLGEWTFRTNGNWNGFMQLRRNDGSGWRVIHDVRSQDDYNISIQDGEESKTGVMYDLVINLTAGAGTSDAMYEFTKTGDSDLIIVVDYSPTTNFKPTESFYFSTPVKLYGSSIVFHQQRLWISRGAVIYCSEVNGLSNFSYIGSYNASKPFSYALADTRSSSINWLHITGQNLFIGTTTSQWQLTSESGVLDSESTRGVKQSDFPTSTLKPIDTGVEFIFVDATQKRLYASRYDYTFELYVSKEISVFADELFEGKVEHINFDQQERLIYLVDDLGNVYLFNYDITENVQGFSVTDYRLVNANESISSIDTIVNNESVIETTVIAFNDSTGNMSMYRIDNDLAGDSYVFNSLITSDYNHFVGTKCYYRTDQSDNWLYQDVTAQTIADNINNQLEMMFPVEMLLKTFPIEFGSAMESTFARKKNTNIVHTMIQDSVNVAISWDPSYDIDNRVGEELVPLIKYNNNQNQNNGVYGYLPDPQSKELEIRFPSQWDDEISLSILEESCYRAMLTGLLIKYTVTD